MRIVLVASAAALCSGCVSIYSPPSKAAPAAEVEYRRDPAVSGLAFQQVLSWTESPACKKISFIGDYHPTTAALGLGGRKEFRVAAAQRVFLLAETIDSNYAPNRYGKCTNVISFAPEVGRRYAVSQTYVRGACRADVVDLADGSVPASFERHEVVDHCMRSR